MKDILADITSDQAVHILKVLWEKRSDVREIIVHEAERLLGPVDPDEIAEDVFLLWIQSMCASYGIDPVPTAMDTRHPKTWPWKWLKRSLTRLVTKS